MRTSLVYLHVCGISEGYEPAIEKTAGTFDYCASRFVHTYKEFPPECDHELVVVLANGLPQNPRIYDGMDVRFLHYRGTGWCSGAHQFAARQLDCDFAVFTTARTHFWKSGWLKRFVDAREVGGDGMYGDMSSNEGGVPHLRTNFYGLHPSVLSDFPHPLDSRSASRTLESGEWNLSIKFVDDSRPSRLVTWDGIYGFPLWRSPANIFCRGDQSACLTRDRHSDLYAKASLEEKEAMEQLKDPVCEY